jgi:RNA polymerase sigma-70 factor, ECF subfamily
VLIAEGPRPLRRAVKADRRVPYWPRLFISGRVFLVYFVGAVGMLGAMGDLGNSEAGGPDWLPGVYAQLRALAGGLMAGERAGHTLQPTALVSEAWLRLAGGPAEPGEFYRAAAVAMRRILVDHARRRGAAKRGGGWDRATLDGDWARTSLGGLDLESEEGCGRLLALDGAIVRLEREDPRAAEIVRLRFYAGLSVDQTAAAMDLSRRTVLRDWEFARAWLLDELQDEVGPDDGRP